MSTIEGKISALEQVIEGYDTQLNEPGITKDERMILLQAKTTARNLLIELMKNGSTPWAIFPDSQRIEKLLTFVVKEVTTQYKIRMDCWTPSRRTQVEQVEFKNSLKSYYQRTRETDDFLNCMVLDTFFPHHIVIASHIWKWSTHGIGLEDFGLNLSDLQSPRNGLLLHRAIEEAFVSNQICFLVDRIHQDRINVRVLCPELNNVVIHDDVTFGAINDTQLHHPVFNLPFRRILDFHAKLSYREAKVRGWIGPEDDFEPFFEISIGASLPDLDHDFDIES